ncbi:MAG: UDP-N-acetylmuramate--alanine ligase, partial [Firmicutes bacterium]|nr:UDP-N-acetylmuramate--alanine ligase [Bacillota bacterium]
AVGVVLNLQRDHKEMDVVAEMFRTFRAQTREAFIVGETENLLEFVPNAVVVGFGEGAIFRAEAVEIGPDHSRFQVEGVTFTLPVPGRHNVENALGALAACRAVGVKLREMVEPLAAFQGVARRFQILGQRRGVTVVDEFGHNPAKVAASLRTAQARASRVLAVFQPHGFCPMRFLRADFVHTFAVELRPVDHLWMLDIFYAGGTAHRDIASKDIVAEIADRGVSAHFAPSRDELIKTLAREAREGDCILVMGARDPSLTDLARSLLQAL